MSTPHQDGNGRQGAGRGPATPPEIAGGERAASSVSGQAGTTPAAAQAAKPPAPWDRFTTWLLAVAAIIVLPCFPLFVEAMKNGGEIRSEDYLLTAAVLAAGYGLASEGNLFRTGYLLIFLFGIGYDFKPEASAVGHLAAAGPAGADWLQRLWRWPWSHPPPASLISVAVLHAIERLQWHIGWDRKFPDWRK